MTETYTTSNSNVNDKPKYKSWFI